MSHPFDATYAPPFPTLPIVIHDPVNGAITSELTAYLDTGSDATIVPAQFLQDLAGEETLPARIRSPWGEVRIVTIYVVDLEVAGHLLPAVDVVVDEQGGEILLGRNVLNQLILLLDVLTRRPTRL
jgi:hypothetical protein